MTDAIRAALAQPEPEVVGPTDQELLELMPEQFREDLATVSRMAAHGAGTGVTPGLFRVSLNTGALSFARAVLARWGHHSPDATKMVGHAEGEVAELIEELRMIRVDVAPCDSDVITRAADLLERQAAPVPVAVSDRLPGPEDCDAEGRCWLYLPDMGTEPLWRLTDPSMRSRYHSHWLPATALPLPQGEVE